MTFTVTDCLLLLWSGAAMSIIGTLIGGILVFRTKRDSHETIFAPRQPKADLQAVNLDDLQAVEEDTDVVPDLFGAKNREFLNQLSAGKAPEEVSEA